MKTNRKPQNAIALVILPGEGYIVVNNGGAFDFITGMQRKGWLSRVSSIKGAGAYLEGIGRAEAFIAYAQANGFHVHITL